SRSNRLPRQVSHLRHLHGWHMFDPLRGSANAASAVRRRAVITGIGPITCIGIGRDAFWRGILAEKSGITRITSFDTSGFRAHCGGEIRDWDATRFFPPHRLKRLDRYAQFSVASALLALD